MTNVETRTRGPLTRTNWEDPWTSPLKATEILHQIMTHMGQTQSFRNLPSARPTEDNNSFYSSSFFRFFFPFMALLNNLMYSLLMYIYIRCTFDACLVFLHLISFRSQYDAEIYIYNSLKFAHARFHILTLYCHPWRHVLRPTESGVDDWVVVVSDET